MNCSQLELAGRRRNPDICQYSICEARNTVSSPFQLLQSELQYDTVLNDSFLRLRIRIDRRKFSCF
jgi:hypothetical protein